MPTISRTFKATSLLETLVSIVLVSVVFSVAVLFLVQLKTDQHNKDISKCLSIIDSYKKETIDNKLYFDEEKTVDQYKISRSVSRVERWNDILFISFSSINVSNKQKYNTVYAVKIDE